MHIFATTYFNTSLVIRGKCLQVPYTSFMGAHKIIVLQTRNNKNIKQSNQLSESVNGKGKK